MGKQEERVEMEEDGLGLESPCDFTFDFRIGVAWGLSILYGSYLEDGLGLASTPTHEAH
jgi:hypothetical protein